VCVWGLKKITVVKKNGVCGVVENYSENVCVGWLNLRLISDKNF